MTAKNNDGATDMASRRASIYIPAHLEPALDLDDGNGLSNRVAAIIDRYEHIIRSTNLPRWTRNEWCLILDACNGWASWAEAGQTLMMGIAAEVEDHIRLNGADEKWQVPRARALELAREIGSLPAAQMMGVIERIERFWRRADMDTDAAMKEAGIEPAA